MNSNLTNRDNNSIKNTIRSAKKNGCPFCGGFKEVGLTAYNVDMGEGMVVIRNVPTTACSQCGEKWIDIKTAQKLEQIVEESREKHHHYQIEVLAL